MFIPDPGSDFFLPDPGSGSASKILTQNIVSKLSEICSGILIPNSDFFHSGSRIQRSKRHRIPDPDPKHSVPVEHYFAFFIVG
jgi:hypothetical protein